MTLVYHLDFAKVVVSFGLFCLLFIYLFVISFSLLHTVPLGFFVILKTQKGPFSFLCLQAVLIRASFLSVWTGVFP